jgi:hypothetical protein
MHPGRALYPILGSKNLTRLSKLKFAPSLSGQLWGISKVASERGGESKGVKGSKESKPIT